MTNPTIYQEPAPIHQNVIEEAVPSYRPIWIAFSVLLMAVGVIFNLIISAVGVGLLFVNIAGWVQENRRPKRKEVVDVSDA